VAAAGAGDLRRAVDDERERLEVVAAGRIAGGEIEERAAALPAAGVPLRVAVPLPLSWT